MVMVGKCYSSKKQFEAFLRNLASLGHLLRPEKNEGKHAAAVCISCLVQSWRSSTWALKRSVGP